MSKKAKETASLLSEIKVGSRVRLTQKTLTRMSKRKTKYLRMAPQFVLHLGTAPGIVYRFEPWDHPLGKVGAAVLFDHEVSGCYWFPFTDLELVLDL